LSFKISKNWRIQIINFAFITTMTAAKWQNTRLIISRLKVRVQMTPTERENGGKNNNLPNRGFVIKKCDIKIINLTFLNPAALAIW